MTLLYKFLLSYCCTAIIVLSCKAQEESAPNHSQRNAISILNRFDTTANSPFWPNISASNLYTNLSNNILRPETIYQGHSTNFCSYSAFTVLLVKEKPETYVNLVLDLYSKGKAEINGTVIAPSAPVRDIAGALPAKGKLVLNGADQLWFLSLPDHFKAYMNLDKKYDPGDENRIWAACTIGKFGKMAEVLGNYKVSSKGTDLIRAGSKDLVEELKECLTKGDVVLYVNSKYLHPSKFRLFTLRAPTHYIILSEIKDEDGAVAVTYWDYGLKTLELMSPKRIRKMTFGIIRLNIP